MASYAISKVLRIVSGGGPVTKDVYQANSGQTWKAGSLLKLTSGKLSVCLDTSGGAAILDTDDTGTSGARLFLALCDHPEIDQGTGDIPVVPLGSNFVSVQEITDDTLLEAQMCAAGSEATDGTALVKGVSFSLYQLQDTESSPYKGSGIIGVDIGTSDAKSIANVIDVATNYDLYNEGLRNDSDGYPTASPSLNYSKVTFKILSAILA